MSLEVVRLAVPHNVTRIPNIPGNVVWSVTEPVVHFFLQERGVRGDVLAHVCVYTRIEESIQNKLRVGDRVIDEILVTYF